MPLQSSRSPKLFQNTEWEKRCSFLREKGRQLRQKQTQQHACEACQGQGHVPVGQHSLESASPHGPWGHPSLPRRTAPLSTDGRHHRGAHEKKGLRLQTAVSQLCCCKPEHLSSVCSPARGGGRAEPQVLHGCHGLPSACVREPTDAPHSCRPSKAGRLQARHRAGHRHSWRCLVRSATCRTVFPLPVNIPAFSLLFPLHLCPFPVLSPSLHPVTNTQSAS